MTTANDMEGKPIKVGSFVGFKDDIEQYGVVKSIKSNVFGHAIIVIESSDGRTGEKFQVEVSSNRVWQE